MTVAALHPFLDQIENEEKLGSQLVHRAYLPAHPADFADLDPPLPAALTRAVAEVAAAKLWRHQVDGIAAARRGEHVLVTTPTASGKSLVFQVPVLEEALAGGPGRALFLFPLKALGQDQKGKFDELAKASGLDAESAGCEIYDGDTPRPRREAIRALPPRVLISNPDMLHAGILASPGPWAPLFGSLRWIVLDELHTYRGIFGSHIYHVVQRLLRLCRHHGASPTLVASSATAANAGQFAEQLTRQQFHLVADSGAPREGRHFLLFQPVTSPYTLALQLLVTFLNAGLKTIVFTKARRITELLYSWLGAQEPSLRDRVASYRAGFLPQERRQIERQLFDGTLDGVISTSALEMGIDVGGLDACILVGFPGSMMATWQRSGRVGREGRESITALVALPDALDQYLLRHPQEFLDRPCEKLIVSPNNETIGRSHLMCAAAEAPLSKQADRDYLERHAPLIGDMLRQFDLAESQDGLELHCPRSGPHRRVSLRGSGATYTITSATSGRPIGTVDGVRVLRECHPGAVYLHAGRQFQIVDLDQGKRTALADPTRVDYFTTPLTEKETEILEILEQRDHGPLRAWLGRVKVTERVVGFERKRIYSQERLGQETLDLPPVEFDTVALWWAAPRAVEETIRQNAEDFMGALHATEHAAISLFPVLALCDRGDLGGISIPFHPQVQCGAVFVYDGYPGGVGIAESGFRALPELLRRVGELLAGCECDTGCPSCIQSPKCGNGNRPLDKAGAARLVRLLLSQEPTLTTATEAAPPEIDLNRWPTMPEQAQPLAEAATLSAEHDAPATTLPAIEPSPLPPPDTDTSGQAPEPAPGSPAPTIYRQSTRPDLFELGDPTPPAEPTPLTADQRAGSGRQFARPALPKQIHTTVLFDLETKRSAAEVGGWQNIHRMGMAVAVTCFMEEGRFRTYHESEVTALIEDLRGADVVIGFNLLRFDYHVLSGYTGIDYRRLLPTLDLFDEVRRTVGFRLGLAHLASETIGRSKTADGLQSLAWFKQGRMDLIEEYCRQDVEVLRDLYLFGRREGFVCFRTRENRRKRSSEADPDTSPEGRVIRVPVDWP